MGWPLIAVLGRGDISPACGLHPRPQPYSEREQVRACAPEFAQGWAADKCGLCLAAATDGVGCWVHRRPVRVPAGGTIRVLALRGASSPGPAADPWLVGRWWDWGCRPPPRMLGALAAGPGGALLALRLAPGRQLAPVHCRPVARLGSWLDWGHRQPPQDAECRDGRSLSLRPARLRRSSIILESTKGRG